MVLKSVAFLDTKVSIDNEGFLTTNLHVKKTDTHQYLHWDSCHPNHCKCSIPYSQAFRIRRIRSGNNNYLRRAQELKGFLVNRGYNEDEVQMQIDKVTKSNREILLQSEPNKTPMDQIPLVVTYHLGLPPLKSVLEKHLPILHVSNRLSMAMRNPPLVAYHRPPNLKSLLIRSAIGKPLPSYRVNSRCDQPHCKTC